jgi:quinoprotein glucose dehydrogenase
LVEVGLNKIKGQVTNPASIERGQHYGNDPGGTRFSPLTQITPQNVDQLKVAWVADTGPVEPQMKVSLEVTPERFGVCTQNADVDFVS